MSKLSVSINAASEGFDSSNHPEMIPANKAQRIQNFVCDQTGYLRGSMRLDIIASFANAPDGVAYYWGVTPDLDRLLVVSGGVLYLSSPTLIAGNIPTWGSFFAVGGGFAIGKQVRHTYWNQETIFVQDGGLQPLRFDGTNLYQLGITGPVAAPSNAGAIPSSGPTKKLGKISYYYSYFDAKYRESEVSPACVVDFVTNPTWDAHLTIGFGSDPQIYGVYIYASTQGGTTAYRIATLLKAGAVTTYEDNALDSIVNTGTQGPHPGQFTIPSPASCIAVHKRHVFLNDTTNSSSLQINNIDSPTQWANVSTLETDGVRYTLTAYQGSPPIAMQPFGSLLGIWTRNTYMQLWGDTTANFIIRPIHQKGALAPSSAIWCDNMHIAIMQDGRFWQISDMDGFIVKPIDNDIQAELQNSLQGDKETASACFIDNKYMCAIGNILYVYDFGAGSNWTSAQWKDPVTLSKSVFTGMVAVKQISAKQAVYLIRSDNNSVCSLDFNPVTNVLVDGIYNSRAFVSKQEGDRFRTQTFKQFGTSKGATTVYGTLTVRMDRGRAVTYNIRGPYDPFQNILFYQELPPAVCEGYEISFELTNLDGNDVVLEKQVVEVSEAGW